MRKRLKVNDNFFAKPTLTNSYWAGFIAADGCVYQNKVGKNRLNIHLCIKDKKHLSLFKDTIKSDHKLSSKANKGFPSIALDIGSEKICDDLHKNFNITSRKSLTLSPPKNLNRKQTLAYIIGYIDGDGSFYTESTTQYCCINIEGTKNFLNWILNSLKNELNGLKGNIFLNHTIFRLRFKGNHAEKVNKLLLKIKTPKLSRKWKF